MTQRCRECGSERIAPNVPVAQGAAVPATSLLGRLRASVCADCGRVTLRADNALEVYLAESGGAARPGTTAEGTAPPAANIQCPSCGSVMSAAARSCEVCGWTDTPR
jgi:hypothetical protein